MMHFLAMGVLAVTVANSQCTHLQGTTGQANILLCMDGTTCNGATQGWDCCTCRGGRKKCPTNFPQLCETPNRCGGGTAHCCSTNCADPGNYQGGIRTCPSSGALAWRNPPAGYCANPVSPCAHLQGTTGVANLLLCMDDTTCDGAVEGWDCCTCRGGRKQCPSNFPELCATPNKCGGGTAHCCSTDCADPGNYQGGIKSCPLAWRNPPAGYCKSPTAMPSMGPSNLPTVLPTFSPTPSPSMPPTTSCLHLQGTTGVANLMLCMDDTTCDGAVEGWDCCTCRGGRKQCPSNFPQLCADPNRCGGGTAHCCSTNCADPGNYHGGIKSCPLAWRPAPAGYCANPTTPPSLSPTPKPVPAPTPYPTVSPTLPPVAPVTPKPTTGTVVDPVAVCAQFHGDKKGCKKAHKKQPNWNKPPCSWDRRQNKCQFWECKSFNTVGWSCNKRGKKKGLKCYHHVTTNTCEPTKPAMTCAMVDSNKKVCEKSSRVETKDIGGCEWDPYGSPSKCVAKGTAGPACGSAGSARKCNKIAGCTYGPGGCVPGVGLTGCARHTSRGKCNADPLGCKYDKKTGTCN